MKRLILAAVSLGVIGGVTLYLNQPKTTPLAPAEQRIAAISQQPMEETPTPTTAIPAPPTPPPISNQPPLAPPVVTAAEPGDPTNSAALTAFRQAIDLLVSPQTSFQQRRATLKQLRDAGKLDQALAALKEGAANHPTSTEYPTALGEAYVYKLQGLRDYHEIAILALQADQSFDTALGLDAANWEARFFKAASLSHWPAEMNKGPEVIEQLSNLIDQQEAMPPQPQFAQTYVLLGDQYKKAGQPEYALQTWRLGLAKFPGDTTLQTRVAHP